MHLYRGHSEQQRLAGQHSPRTSGQRVRHGRGQVWACEQWGTGWTWRPPHPGKGLHRCTPSHQRGPIDLRLQKTQEGEAVHSTRRERRKHHGWG